MRQPNSSPDVSIVLPVYLNRGQLPELYRRLGEALTPVIGGFELVFVDDRGEDGSRAWLDACARQDPRVVVVEMPSNQGQHRAALRGLRTASGRVVVIMDADLQDPPEAIPLLTGALGDDDAVVLARRHTPYQAHHRHLTGFAFKRLLRILAGSQIPTGTGMFLVMSRRVVDAVVNLSATAAYVPLLLAWTGFPLRTIDVDKAPRPEGRSGYTTRRRLGLALRALWGALTRNAGAKRPRTSLRASRLRR